MMGPSSSVWARFSRRKQLDAPGEGDEHSSKLDKCLNTFDLTALGIGATLGEREHGSLFRDPWRDIVRFSLRQFVLVYINILLINYRFC